LPEEQKNFEIGGFAGERMKKRSGAEAFENKI